MNGFLVGHAQRARKTRFGETGVALANFKSMGWGHVYFILIFFSAADTMKRHLQKKTKKKKTGMLGSILSRLAAPTTDCENGASR